jgi:molybdopterin-containing oxidoreductase family iron-sulfur binding subunit
MTNRSLESAGIDPSDIRARLAGERGPRYWRSLEELAGSEAFQDYLRREFPSQSSVWSDPSSRRHFLRLMGASLALAGVSGCAFQPPEYITPYVRSPEEILPGQPLYYATALCLGGYASGVIVESHMGRPIKVEGNPDHPASLGGTDPFLQAAVLSLYDPDRSQVVLFNGRVSTWDGFVSGVLDVRESLRATKGRGLRVLTETVTSPTLAAQLQELVTEFPEARWHQHEPVGREAMRDGARLAFGEGREVDPIYDCEKADVIVSLDADFLAWSPSRLRDARAFAARRDVTPQTTERMNRLYVAECTPSLTGAMADHRWPVRARDVLGLAQDLARALRVEGAPAAAGGPAPEWIGPVADDLRAHAGRCLVLAGDGQPAAVHALAHAMNHALGNVGPGKPLRYVAPVAAGPGAPLAELVRDMRAGQVETLVVLGGNPLYSAPADFEFGAALGRVRRILHLGQYEDETAALSHWHVPEAHPLESWGDACAFDGTVTIQQPLIAPLYGGKTASDVLEAFLGRPNRPTLEVIRGYWQGQTLPGDFEATWRTALHNGFLAGRAAEPRDATPRALPTDVWTRPKAAAEGDLELVFRPDPTIWDGRFANNGWLQELPKPLTKLTWENAALMSPKTAARLGLKVDELTGDADMVELFYERAVPGDPQGRKVRRRLRHWIWIVPGHADDSVTVTLGYDRSRAGRVGSGLGGNAYALRTSDAPWFGDGLRVVAAGKRHRLAVTQQHHRMEGRELVRVATAEQFRTDPEFAREPDKHYTRELTLYEDPEPQLRREQGEGNAWGMAINTNTCIGCNACVVACQAENNIPVVGKAEVLRSREMHWLRIDRYFEGDEANPNTYFQPVLCMHCEKAPCEVVCPVGATTHSYEGLNEMTYNRCVGTKYCSNNCPYKVRRFNFFQYSDESTPSLKLLNNPDVTVRSLGVMEKCTYCVQRINQARITAEIENRAVRGDEVETACQGACPTRAIVFGNLNDPKAAVVQAKGDPRNYALLAELNTRPRTTYLARLRNPNPRLESPQSEEAAHDGDHAS